jgi:hypothetical protein
VLDKHVLRNGNVFIWLGTGTGWASGANFDNVLMLTGGDVLFLKTSKSISLNDESVRGDLFSLSHDDFVKKYEVPMSHELWVDLRTGLKSGEYPLLSKSEKMRLWELREAVMLYVRRVVEMPDGREKASILNEIERELMNTRMKGYRRPSDTEKGVN